MFNIVIDDNVTLILSNVQRAEVTDQLGIVKFYDYSDKIIAMFKVSDIKGFYEDTSYRIKEK